ncbi:MAG: fibronectin type III domain-containing protein, partial [Acidimicrobiales bacterium]
FCIFESGTEIQFSAPAIATASSTTVQPVALPVTVVSLAGESGQENVVYAGVPKVTSVRNSANTRTVLGVYGAPDSGGAPLVITGSGFNQAVGPAVFTDVVQTALVQTQYSYTVSSDTSASLQSIAQNPGVDMVSLCSVTGCSGSSPGDLLVVYPPGAPKVEASSPSSGPAHGGTQVTIVGQNLGCAVEVSFGTTAASSFANAPQLLDCGSSSVVGVSVPPGRAGSTVSITVVTAESIYAGTGATARSSAAVFRYAASSPSAPQNLKARFFGNGRVLLRWTAPSDNGGSSVTRYRIRASAKDQRTVVFFRGSVGHFAVVRNLTKGIKYTFSVAAVSRLGVGLSASVAFTPRP